MDDNTNITSDTKRMHAPEGQSPDGVICPSCGQPIPDGMLYCENCGEEIHFVPEFEPEVDDSINSAMTNVAQEIAEAELPAEAPPASRDYIEIRLRIPKRSIRIAAAGLAVAAIVTVAVLAIPHIMSLQLFDRNSHASEVTVADGNKTPVSIGEHMIAPEPVTAEPLPESTAPNAPRFDCPSGRYEGELAVELANPVSTLKYYYTTDGTPADINAKRYLGPIIFDREGESTLRMIAVNEAGEVSEETIAVFTIAAAASQAPVILEDSGEYTQSTMIVAVMQENCRITYTTDGSEPGIDSTEYTAPIKMPVGNSLFRFRAFDAEGKGSEIVERSYHLVYARLVSEEQAIASVVQVLLDKNVLIDDTGRVFGGAGRNVYVVESVIEIEGAGEYYRIVERYVETDGSSTDTGLLYAVNTNNGSVHRLGYDSSGKYTLFTLAAR